MLKFWKKLNELYGWLLIVLFGFIMLIGIRELRKAPRERILS